MQFWASTLRLKLSLLADEGRGLSQHIVAHQKAQTLHTCVPSARRELLTLSNDSILQHLIASYPGFEVN
jgi:hypothetical protein